MCFATQYGRLVLCCFGFLLILAACLRSEMGCWSIGGSYFLLTIQSLMITQIKYCTDRIVKEKEVWFLGFGEDVRGSAQVAGTGHSHVTTKAAACLSVLCSRADHLTLR